MKKKIINVVTLGCSKNIVDSEHLMAQLRRNNFEIKFDSNTTVQNRRRQHMRFHRATPKRSR